MIEDNYDATDILDLKDLHPKELLAVSASFIGKTCKYKMIMGHMPYGVHRYLNIRDPKYFTFLRDPVDRFLSDVANNRRHANNVFHEKLTAPGLTEDQIISVALDISYYRNTLVHFVCGSYSTETVSMSQLGVAIDNLWASEFVGLTEEFEISTLLMARKLGWKRIIPQKCQVRPDARQPVPPELKARLDRALAYDRMLYAIGQEYLDQKKREHGPLLSEAAHQLAEFIRMQDIEHPDAKFISRWGVTQVPLNDYNARVKKGSPLYRWTYD